MKYTLIRVALSKQSASNEAKELKQSIESRGGKVSYKIKEVPKQRIEKMTVSWSPYRKKKSYGIYWNVIKSPRD